MRLKSMDYLILLLVLAAAIGSAVFVYSGGNGPLRVKIRTDENIFIYPLDEDREIAVEGPLGTSYIHIHDEHAAFVESPCSNKLCIQAGELDESGEWSACMPNRIFMEIEGGSPAEEVDVTTY